MQIFKSAKPEVMDAMSTLPPAAWCLWLVAEFRALCGPHSAAGYGGLQSHLARAEAAGELREFQALVIQSILAMSEHCDFAIDYLDMAAAVAGSDGERAIVAEARAAHDCLVRGLAVGIEHRPEAHGGERMGRWDRFIAELARLGLVGPDVRRSVLAPCAP